MKSLTDVFKTVKSLCGWTVLTLSWKLLKNGLRMDFKERPQNICVLYNTGSSRTNLNLRHLNEFVRYRHFKMESLTDVFKTIKSLCG